MAIAWLNDAMASDGARRHDPRPFAAPTTSVRAGASVANSASSLLTNWVGVAVEVGGADTAPDGLAALEGTAEVGVGPPSTNPPALSAMWCDPDPAAIAAMTITATSTTPPTVSAVQGRRWLAAGAVLAEG